MDRQAATRGAWMRPDGTTVPVSSAWQQRKVMEELVPGARVPRDAFSRGFVKVVLEPRFEVEGRSLTGQQKNALLGMMRDSRADSFSISLGSRRGQFSRGEMDKVEKMVRHASSRAAALAYGAWVSPDGAVLRVMDAYAHNSVIKKSTGMKKDEAIDEGWARLIFMPFFSVHTRSKALPLAQREVIEDMMESSRASVLEIDRGGKYREFAREDMDDAMKMLRASSGDVRTGASRTALLGRGAWVSPQGDVYPVIHRMEHNDVLQELGLKSYADAFKRGFARLVYQPFAMETYSLTPRQKRVILDLFRQAGIGSGDVYFDVWKDHLKFSPGEEDAAEGAIMAARSILAVARELIKAKP